MPRSHRPRNLELTDLFTPPPSRPTWDTLPATVTRKLGELLAELLRGHLDRQARPARGKEKTNE